MSCTDEVFGKGKGSGASSSAASGTSAIARPSPPHRRGSAAARPSETQLSCQRQAAMPWCPAFQGDQVILITVSRNREAVSLHAVSIESPHGLQAYHITRSLIEADFARAIPSDMLLLDVPGRRLRSIH